MIRRTLLALPALALVPAAHAQPPRPVVIGILNWTTLAVDDLLLTEFTRAGYTSARGVTLAVRNCAGSATTAASVAAELVALRPDLIIATATGPALAAKAATSQIPILVSAADPLGSGLVSSLARPDGNITGVSVSSFELIAKRLEIASQLIPGLARTAFLAQLGEPNVARFESALAEAGTRLGVQVFTIGAAPDASLTVAIGEAAAGGAQVVLPQPIFLDGPCIAAAALRHRMPVVADGRALALAGIPLTYGIDRAYTWSRLVAMADRILRGAKPADLPLEQGLRTLLHVNLRAASAIGLTIPAALIDRADEVIE